jgi:hypothetical protein
MDGQLGGPDLPPTTPLRPTQLGRGLPVPPVVALIGVVGLFVGLALGYGIAPKPGPQPSSSPTIATMSLVESASPSASLALPVAPTAEPTPSAYELPPAGGLTLSQALAALNQNGISVSESAVIYARVERYGEATPNTFAGSPDEWVWAIAIRGSFEGHGCGGYRSSPGPCPAPATTEMLILDYDTGAFLEAWSPALL